MDLAPRRASLDEMYGPLSGDLTLHLLNGHLDAGGVELTGDGYAPGTIDELGWDAADTDGVKRPADLVDCGTPTEAWSDTATHYVLRDGSDDSWGCFRLASPLTVGGAGSAVEILPAVFFGENDN